jgi:hypothetical protein
MILAHMGMRIPHSTRWVWVCIPRAADIGGAAPLAQCVRIRATAWLPGTSYPGAQPSERRGATRPLQRSRNGVAYDRSGSLADVQTDPLPRSRNAGVVFRPLPLSPSHKGRGSILGRWPFSAPLPPPRRARFVTECTRPRTRAARPVPPRNCRPSTRARRR